MAAKAKNDRNQLKNDQIGQQNSQNQLYNDFRNRQSDMARTAYNENSAKTGDLWNSYAGLAAGNRAPNETTAGALTAPSSGGGGGNGGGNAGAGSDYFSEAEGYARNLAGPMGGLNPEFYKNMMNNGGLDDKAINNFRGNGVYEEFQKTGGWSDADKANYRSRAGAVLPAVYGNMANEMARRRNVQGGYGAGFDASSQAMARQSAQQMAEANINAELGLADQIRSGRQWGAEGGTNAENALQSLRTGNMINTEGLAQQGRTSGAGMLTNIAGGRTQRDSSAAATGAANRATDAANARFEQQLAWDRERTGLAGQSELMSMLYGQQNNYDDRSLAGMGQQDQWNNSMYGNRQNGINSTPGWQDVAAPFVGAAAGALGGMFGGGSGSGGGYNVGRMPSYYNTGISGGRNPWANVQF